MPELLMLCYALFTNTPKLKENQMDLPSNFQETNELLATAALVNRTEDIFLLEEDQNVFAVYVSQETGQFLYEQIGCTHDGEC